MKLSKVTDLVKIEQGLKNAEIEIGKRGGRYLVFKGTDAETQIIDRVLKLKSLIVSQLIPSSKKLKKFAEFQMFRLPLL